MSIARLQHEEEMRRMEEELRLADEKTLQAVRAELDQQEPPRRLRVIPVLTDPYEECAAMVLAWFKGGEPRPHHTSASVRSLVREMRARGRRGP